MLRTVSLVCSSANLCKNTRQAWALTSAVRFSDKKKGDDIESDLLKNLKNLNEILKTVISEAETNRNLEKKMEEPKEVDKNFMNFRKQAEKKSFQRSSIFNWKVALGTLAIGGSCLAALFYIKKIRLEEREKYRKKQEKKNRKKQSSWLRST